MSRRRPEFTNRRGPSKARVDRGDGVGCGAPDLTFRIMERLGYEQVSEVESRRRARRRWAARAALVLAFTAAASAGLYWHGHSDRALRPESATLPDAVATDARAYRARFDALGRAVNRMLTIQATPYVEDDAPALELMIVPIGVDADAEPARSRPSPEQSRVPWSGLL